MRALATLLGALLLPTLAVAQPPVQRASLQLDYRFRDMADYVSEDYRVDLTLRIERGRAELTVRGRYELQSAELTPAGPGRSSHHESDVDSTWRGTARPEGGGWLVRFDTEPGFEWRCLPARETVGGQARAVLRCGPERPVSWGPPGRPVPAYFRVPICFAAPVIANRVFASFGGSTHVVLE
ncbi:MAG: hypothetical protein KC619_19895 [Myxococcales bacterium]|nr:hypothetical protein [Myxococcales bacterium]